MRFATGLHTLALFAAVMGCRSQPASLSNPFLTPDRVPPPTTQIPPPGAATPLYGGDLRGGASPIASPAPQSPAGQFAPPASVTPPSPYPVGPATPLPAGSSVPPPSAWPTYPSQARANGASLDFSAAPGGAVQQAAFNEPSSATASSPLQRLQSRELAPGQLISTPAGGVAPSAAPAWPAAGGDGFRPQSSTSQPATTSESADAKGFRPPSLGAGRAASSAGKASHERFAVGPAQEWLRGQLEYWPESGQWSIRYMPDGQVDQIGGRILIDNPQVLGNLSPGEFVAVEGQVFGRQVDDSFYQPVYRVSVVQRQRQ